MNKIVGLFVGLFVLMGVSVIEAKEHLSEKTHDEMYEMVSPLWQLLRDQDEAGQVAIMFGMIMSENECAQRNVDSLQERLDILGAEFLKTFMYVAELSLSGDDVTKGIERAGMLLEAQVNVINDVMEKCLSEDEGEVVNPAHFNTI